MSDITARSEQHPTGRNSCRTCGRELQNWRECGLSDPAMDCGGDCLGCVEQFEGAWQEVDCELEGEDE